MKEILEHLYQHKKLSKEESRDILIKIASGAYNDYQIASFLTAFIMRNISLEELRGFQEALRELALPIDLSAYDPMDLCGTGGDGKNTFNISTLTSFVAAGAGIPIAKHGNYGVSSVSGSSNVLEALGVTFQSEESKLREQLEKAGICFLHAPLFHPAMKQVGPVRKQLGVKTFFNMLGPLVNPAKPTKQMTGVFNLELARMYQYLFQEEDMQFTVVHAIDGFDEITLTGNCKVITNNHEQIVSAATFGVEPVTPEAILGGDTVEEAAAIFMRIINGNGTEAQNNVVLANAAMAIQTYHQELSLDDCLEKASDSLKGKRALKALNTLKQLS